MRENRTYGSEGGVSRWLIPTPIAIKRLHPWNINGGRRVAFPPYRTTGLNCLGGSSLLLFPAMRSEAKQGQACEHHCVGLGFGDGSSGKHRSIFPMDRISVSHVIIIDVKYTKTHRR